MSFARCLVTSAELTAVGMAMALALHWRLGFASVSFYVGYALYAVGAGSIHLYFGGRTSATARPAD